MSIVYNYLSSASSFAEGKVIRAHFELTAAIVCCPHRVAMRLSMPGNGNLMPNGGVVGGRRKCLCDENLLILFG